MDHPELPQTWIVDPEGVRDDEALLDDLRSREIRIIFVEPPVAASVLAQVREALDRYCKTVGIVHEGEPVINFHSPKYASFRADPHNCYDGIHLTLQGARTISQAWKAELQGVFAESLNN